MTQTPVPARVDADAETHRREVAPIARHAAWRAGAESDRLERAFAAMESAGISPRMDITCCGAHGEMGSRRDGSEPDAGYVFFHDHDAAWLDSGESLQLSFGAIPSQDTPEGLEGAELDRQLAAGRAAIANKIVRILRAEGLDASWSDGRGHRIVVAGVIH